MTPTVSIGPHRLYLGDAYAIRPTLGWMDADVMDPPYVIRAQGGGSFRKHRPYLDQIMKEGLDKGFDHAIVNPLLCGAAVVFCHNDQVPAASASLDGLFHRFVLCVWQKTTPMPVANKHYVPEIEIYFHAWNRAFHPQGELADLRRVFACRSRALKDFGHPTVKPDELMDKNHAQRRGYHGLRSLHGHRQHRRCRDQGRQGLHRHRAQPQALRHRRAPPHRGMGKQRARGRVTQTLTHYWRLRATLPERHGHPCRLIAVGKMNTIQIEFADGVRHIVSRYAVRRLQQ